MKFAWPFVWRSEHDRVRLENYTLRDALREVNNELRRHRKLISEIKHGQNDTATTFEKIIAGK